MIVDMSQYLDVFFEESREHLSNLNQCLLKLEQNPQDMAALNEIFRAAHTLKGMSSTMGFEDMADLTHHMEDILSDLKEGVLSADHYTVDVLFKCLDRIQEMVEKIESGRTEHTDYSELITTLENIRSGNLEAAAVNEAVVKEATVEVKPICQNQVDQDFGFNDYDVTVLKEALSRGFRIYYLVVGVDSGCLMKAVRSFMVFKVLEEDGEIMKSLPSAQDLEEGKFDEEFSLVLISKSSLEDINQRLNSISEIKVNQSREVEIAALQHGEDTVEAIVEDQVQAGEVSGIQKTTKIRPKVRVDIEKLDEMMNLVGELVMHKGRLEQIGLVSRINELNETVEQVDRITTELQSVVMKVRMVPIEQVFNRFPRMVRDLARDLHKEIDFVMEGKETELDRTVIDEIGDPLVHLLRNAIDHGIELPEVRAQKGKPQRGTVRIRAKHEGNNVFIEVEDDGAGIDIQRVIDKAIDKGIILAKDVEFMSNEETYRLLFSPGFSTAAAITDVSGRGVGLDVVKSKMEGIGGEISIDSKPGRGTRFTIKLPLTLAIIQALMVSVGKEIYAIPLSSVDETTMVQDTEIKMVQGQEVIMLRGNVLPLFRLRSIIEVPGEEGEQSEMYVVIVRKGERQIGLVVDSLIGQQEIVIKSLGRSLAGIPGLAGAIVAGDGNVRLILEITTLF